MMVREPNKKRRRRLIIGAVVVVIMALIFAMLAYNHYNQKKAAEAQSQIDGVPTATATDFQQVSPDVPLYVLCVGIDDKTDDKAIFVGVAAINKDKNHIDFIMLPDNTKIEGRKEKGTQTLQSVYDEGGLSLVRAVVEDIFHLPIPYYAVYKTDTLAKMVDMAGGVPMYVEKNMYQVNAADTPVVDLYQGYQTMHGDDAVQYMRYVDSDGNISRTLRQERFVKVFYEDREKNHFGLTNMLFMYRFWNNVDSNISAKDMAHLAWSFRGVPVEDIQFYILPGEVGKEKLDEGYWTFDPVEVQKILGTTNNAIATAPDPEEKDKE